MNTYSTISKAYDLLDRTYFAEKGNNPRKVIQELIPDASVKVLDMCCGTLSNTFSIAKMSNLIKITGVDISEEMLKQANDKLKGTATLILGDAENITLETNSFDLLLCTTIIENGLDVPLANTIIIQGAENFGLSQLYQMRGRVGRSSRLAYAYFLYKKQKALSEIAQKRLQAIRDFTELGAGFQIAMRDLEIRGAGNILGAQQHGHIAGIGFAAYCQLLEDTINRLQNGDTPKETQLEPVMEIKLDAYIPNNYIENPRYKLEIYRRLSEMVYGESNDLLDEIIDRFGNPPKEVENL